MELLRKSKLKPVSGCLAFVCCGQPSRFWVTILLIPRWSIPVFDLEKNKRDENFIRKGKEMEFSCGAYAVSLALNGCLLLGKLYPSPRCMPGKAKFIINPSGILKFAPCNVRQRFDMYIKKRKVFGSNCLFRWLTFFFPPFSLKWNHRKKLNCSKRF